MKTKYIVVLMFSILFGACNIVAQEDYNRAQKSPQTKEVVISKNIRTRQGHDSFQAAYKAALREAKQANPNKDVAIRSLTKGDVKVNSDGSVSYYYTYTIIAELNRPQLKIKTSPNWILYQRRCSNPATPF